MNGRAYDRETFRKEFMNCATFENESWRPVLGSPSCKQQKNTGGRGFFLSRLTCERQSAETALQTRHSGASISAV